MDTTRSVLVYKKILFTGTWAFAITANGYATYKKTIAQTGNFYVVTDEAGSPVTYVFDGSRRAIIIDLSVSENIVMIQGAITSRTVGDTTI